MPMAEDRGVMSETQTQAETRRCPRCGSAEATRILYGLPTHEAWEAAQRGEIAIGGCIVGPESPDFECSGCGAAVPWPAPDA